MDKTYLQNGNDFETIYFRDCKKYTDIPLLARSSIVKQQWESYWSNRSEIVGDFDSASELVLEILRKIPSSRNSDKNLFAEIFKYYKIPINLEHLNSMPSLESFTRARRKIQETDYQASDEVQSVREENEDDMRVHISEI